jgi:membrane fusion protein (multidrug efflux system)
VTLYEVTGSARLEVDRAVYPVAAPVAGRVTEARLAIGRDVAAGDILVELDTSAEQLQIREERTRQDALRASVAALRAQIGAEENARGEERQAARIGTDENRAQAREAQAAAVHAEGELRRVEQLRSQGLISERDYQQARNDAERLRATAESRAFSVERTGQEQRTRESDRIARVRGFEAQIAALESQIPTIDATIDRLRNEIERHRVRAPMSGRLGEAVVLRPGAVVQEGLRLGAIVPSGRLMAVAQFPPDAALGLIRPGQAATLRLDGFPWIQYGTVSARVAHVAGEVRDGTVRVELAIDSAGTKIPLQHGLPGSIEIAVERATPWALILRHAGRNWSAPETN